MYTLATLTRDIESGASISVHKDGTWHKRWDPKGITTFFRRLFKLEFSDNLALASLVKHFIKSTELTSKTLHIQHVPDSKIEIKRAINAVKMRLASKQAEEVKEHKRLTDALSEAKTLRDLTEDGLKLARQYKHDVDSIPGIEDRLSTIEKEIEKRKLAIEQHELTAPASKKLSSLAKHFFAQKLRETPQETLNNTPADEQDMEWVKGELTTWKKLQFPSLHTVKEDGSISYDFSKADLTKIECLCRYKKAIKLMKEDRGYRESVFKLVFRAPHHNFVDIAVQFPGLSKKITSCYVDKRVKRLAKTVGLSVKEEIKEGIVHKDVCLRINKQDEPLSNMKRKITFQDIKTGRDRVLSIDEIFHDFRTKDSTGTSPFEFTENGVDLCYTKDPLIDFKSDNWWESLPVIEHLTRDEVEARYNVSMAGKKSLLTVKATREKDPLNVQNNHAWLQFIIPLKDGTYSVHAFGKYARVYPQGTLEKLLFIFNTHPGVIVTIDENEFYSHREHTAVTKTLTGAQFERLMSKLKSDLEASSQGNIVFQAQGQNCSSWVQDVLDEVFGQDEQGHSRIPRLFEVPVVEASAPWLVNYAIKTIRFVEKFSHQLAKIVRFAIARLLGGRNAIITRRDGKEVVNSTMTNERWQRGYLTLPALLFSREKQHKLKEAFNTCVA